MHLTFIANVNTKKEKGNGEYIYMKQCISDAYIGLTLHFRISSWTTRSRKHFFIRNTPPMTFCIVKVFYMEDDEAQALFYVLFWLRSSIIQPLWSIFFIFLVSFGKRDNICFHPWHFKAILCEEVFLLNYIICLNSKYTRCP